MRREILSSRERVQLALQHQATDRIPIAMVCSLINPPAYQALAEHLRRQRGLSVQAYLDSFIDIREVAPTYMGPPLKPGEDIWGVIRSPVSYGVGSYDEIAWYPEKQTSFFQVEAKNLGDLKTHRWPSPNWFDYDSLTGRIAIAQAESERCLMVTNGNIFETTWYMRGFQQIFMDFVLNPELAHTILGGVTDFYIQYFTRLLETASGAVDLVFTADDIAGQSGLLMSLKMWEEFIKPYHARLNKAIHEFGVGVIYHSDGAVMEAVGGLVEMGIDVLQALQFSADGMNPRMLKRKYGDCLCFEGGVSVQTTLPFGTPQDVQRETEELIRVLGKNGGYILGPSHSIQAGTPPENILAMFDTALNFYPY